MIVKKATGHKPSKLNLIYSKENFIEQFADILHDATELSDADFDVLLVYLSRDSGAISYDGKVNKCYIQLFLIELLADYHRPSNSSLRATQQISLNKIQPLPPSRLLYQQ